MPRNTSSVIIDDRKLTAIIRNSGTNARQAIRNIAFAVETGAKLRAPVDIGALRASIYTVMGNEQIPMPQVPGEPRRVALPQPRSKLEAHIGPSVDYGIYQEFGTRRMAAQPYLVPALRAAEEIVPEEFRRVVTDE
jgi:HK97 gp10 family phage protein